MNNTTYASHPLDNIPLVKEPNESIPCHTPETVSAFCQDLLPLSQEAFCIITLNSKNRIINRRLLTFGTLDAALIDPREVFKWALLTEKTAALILVHNHPSGELTPSAEDLRITKRIVEAGHIMGINVMDHIIVGQTNQPITHYSMRETGLVCFATI